MHSNKAKRVPALLLAALLSSQVCLPVPYVGVPVTQAYADENYIDLNEVFQQWVNYPGANLGPAYAAGWKYGVPSGKTDKSLYTTENVGFTGFYNPYLMSFTTGTFSCDFESGDGDPWGFAWGIQKTQNAAGQDVYSFYMYEECGHNHWCIARVDSWTPALDTSPHKGPVYHCTIDAADNQYNTTGHDHNGWKGSVGFASGEVLAYGNATVQNVRHRVSIQVTKKNITVTSDGVQRAKVDAPVRAGSFGPCTASNSSAYFYNLSMEAAEDNGALKTNFITYDDGVVSSAGGIGDTLSMENDTWVDPATQATIRNTTWTVYDPSGAQIYTGANPYTGVVDKEGEYRIVLEVLTSQGIRGKKTKYFSVSNDSIVTVRYVDESGEKLCDNVVMRGKAGKPYVTQDISFNGYVLTGVEGEREGTYQKGAIGVTYTYKKVDEGDVSEDVDSAQPVLVKYVDVADSSKLADDIIYRGSVGDDYATNKLKIPGYNFVRVEDSMDSVTARALRDPLRKAAPATSDEAVSAAPSAQDVAATKAAPEASDPEALGELANASAAEKDAVPAAWDKAAQASVAEQEAAEPAASGAENAAASTDLLVEEAELLGKEENVVPDPDAELKEEASQPAGTPEESLMATLNDAIFEKAYAAAEDSIEGKFGFQSHTITYYYNSNPNADPNEAGSVVVRFVDENGHTVAPDVVRDGSVDESFSVDVPTITKYDVQTIDGQPVTGDVSSASVDGSLKKQPRVMTVVYKARTYTASSVMVLYVDPEGNTIRSEVIDGNAGDSYTTHAMEIPGYELVSTPANASGTFATNVTRVIYQYKSTLNKPDPKDPDKTINEDTTGDGEPNMNVDTDGDGESDVNIDTDGDGKPDVNVILDEKGDPASVDVDDPPAPRVNIDTDKDGIPDTNVDIDGDGKPDVNIVDEDGDGEPDPVDPKKTPLPKPTVNIVDADGDGEPDPIDLSDPQKPAPSPNVNVDTDGDGKPDLNKDVDGDGKPDVNIVDADGDGTSDPIDVTDPQKPAPKPNVNVDVDGDDKPDVNKDTTGDGKPDLDIVDTDGDGVPDPILITVDPENPAPKPNVNVDADGDGKPDLNKDVDGDGKPDVNIVDADGDGKPDPIDTSDPEKVPDPNVNVDSDNNDIPDENVDTNGDGKPDVNIVDEDGDGIPDPIKLPVDPEHKPTPTVNIVDKDGDGTPDTNIDPKNPPLPDVNVDTNGDGKPDVNIDTDKDGTPDLNIVDEDHDGKPDPVDPHRSPAPTPNVNVDTNGDGKPELNVDIDGNGKPDINVDTNGDGKADVNIDTNDDGVPDLNLVDLDQDGKPDHDIDNSDPTKPTFPNINVDTNGDGVADLNIDTNGDGIPDKNVILDAQGRFAQIDPANPPALPADDVAAPTVTPAKASGIAPATGDEPIFAAALLGIATVLTGAIAWLRRRLG